MSASQVHRSLPETHEWQHVAGEANGWLHSEGQFDETIQDLSRAHASQLLQWQMQLSANINPNRGSIGTYRIL